MRAGAFDCTVGQTCQSGNCACFGFKILCGGPASTSGSTIITVAVAGTLPLQREMLRREVHLLPLRRGVHRPRTLLQLPFQRADDLCLRGGAYMR
jgi:hypothetical protein